ncbi:hypothetical protein ACU4GD_02315 [Cupriavidus basilensis]
MSALGLLSPVSATVLGFLVLGQTLSTAQMAGSFAGAGKRVAGPARAGGCGAAGAGAAGSRWRGDCRCRTDRGERRAVFTASWRA